MPTRLEDNIYSDLLGLAARLTAGPLDSLDPEARQRMEDEAAGSEVLGDMPGQPGSMLKAIIPTRKNLDFFAELINEVGRLPNIKRMPLALQGPLAYFFTRYPRVASKKVKRFSYDPALPEGLGGRALLPTGNADPKVVLGPTLLQHPSSTVVNVLGHETQHVLDKINKHPSVTGPLAGIDPMKGKLAEWLYTIASTERRARKTGSSVEAGYKKFLELLENVMKEGK